MTDTYVSPVSGDELVFKFGNDAAPIVYTAVCSINTDRKVDLSSEIVESTRANCTDPSKPAKKSRRVKSTDIKFNGAGVADLPSFKTLMQLWEAAEPFPGKLVQASVGGFTITGNWVIESLSVGGTSKEDQNFDISLAIADADYVIAYPV